MEESQMYPQVARIVNELLCTWHPTPRIINHNQSCPIQYLLFVGVKLFESSSETRELGSLTFYGIGLSQGYSCLKVL